MGDSFELIWQLAIIIGGVVLFAVLLTLFLYFRLRRKQKEKVIDQPVVIDSNKWVNALGGNNNIVSIEVKGSRLIVYINDNTQVNKDELHELGVSSIISSQDKVTLVLKENAENIRNLLQ